MEAEPTGTLTTSIQASGLSKPYWKQCMLGVSSRELSGLPHSPLSYMLLWVLVGGMHTGMHTATALKPKEPPAPAAAARTAGTARTQIGLGRQRCGGAPDLSWSFCGELVDEFDEVGMLQARHQERPPPGALGLRRDLFFLRRREPAVRRPL